MAPNHQRNFRRGASLIRYGGWPAVKVVNTATSDATFRALEQPCVIASNHRSVLDAIVGIRAVGALGHTARVLSASWLWEDKRLARLLDTIGAVPLQVGRAAVETVDEAIEILKAGEHLLMTPEGRVVPPDERVGGVGEGHKILSKIVTGAGVKVIPAAAVGTDLVWPLGQSRPRIRPWNRPLVGIGFGDPVECLSRSHRENVDTVMAHIAEVVCTIEALIPAKA